MDDVRWRIDDGCWMVADGWWMIDVVGWTKDERRSVRACVRVFSDRLRTSRMNLHKVRLESTGMNLQV